MFKSLCYFPAHTQGRWGYRRVLAAFGGAHPTILDPATDEIDRDALGQLVFSDAAARRRLNAATHLPIAVELICQVAVAWLTFRLVVVR